jgi:hypothetical protein
MGDMILILSEYLDYLYEMAAIDKWIAKQVAKGNRQAIRNYIHRMINQGDRAIRGNIVTFHRPLYIDMVKAFHTRETPIEKLADLAKKAGRLQHKVPAKYQYSDGRNLLQKLKSKNMNRRLSSRKGDMLPYHKHVEKDPEEYINISHGGGIRYLKKFMRGKSKGYELERRAGKGIQVTPHEKDISDSITSRGPDYASRASARHFDDPVLMTAKIKRKHLMAANNKYEAGLTADKIKKLKDIKIKKLRINKGDFPV